MIESRRTFERKEGQGKWHGKRIPGGHCQAEKPESAGSLWKPPTEVI
jgi:hypothetical protein